MFIINCLIRREKYGRIDEAIFSKIINTAFVCVMERMSLGHRGDGILYSG